MEKDYYYNKEILNNYKNIYENTDEKKLYIKYVEYKNISNFSDLFNKKSTASSDEAIRKYLEQELQRRGFSATDIRTALQQLNIDSKQQRTIDGILFNQVPQTTSVGRSYDADNMWSPISTAGYTYEWNRGVIGIAYDGSIEKESLDETYNHHADATIKISKLLGKNPKYAVNPFEAALNATQEGLVILQSEGDNCFVYFPEVITAEQLNGIVACVTPRSKFDFSFTHDEEIYEEQSYQEVIDFATNIANKLSSQVSVARKL